MVSRRGLFKGAVGLGLLGGLPAALAGCGSGDSGSSSKSGTLNALIAKDAQNAQAQSEWFDSVAKQLQASHPDVKVNWSTFSSASEEMQKLQTGVATQTGPDVFNFGGTVLPTAYSTNGIRVLSDADWKLVGGKDAILPQPLAMGGPDATSLIGVPYAMRPFAMVYNKELFDKAGIAKPPTTWDDFVAAAKELTNPKAGVYGTAMNLADGFESWKIVWMLTRQAGGRIISEDMSTAQLDSEVVEAQFAFWFSWLTKDHIVTPRSVTNQTAEATKAFAAGKLGMQLMTNATIIPTLDASPVKDKYAFTSHPTIPHGMTSTPAGGVPVSSFTSGDMMTVTKSSKNPDLAYSLIGAMLTYDNQLKLNKATGNLPTNAKAAAHLADTSPIWKAFVDAEKASEKLPFTGSWGTVETALTSATTNLANKVASAGTVSQADINTELKRENNNVQASIRK